LPNNRREECVLKRGGGQPFQGGKNPVVRLPMGGREGLQKLAHEPGGVQKLLGLGKEARARQRGKGRERPGSQS